MIRAVFVSATSDRGVVQRLIAVGVVGVAGVLLTRRHREARLVVIGIALLTVGFVGLGALH